MSTPLRIAVVSTPRSGNTWLRRLLQAVYGVQEVAVHQLADDDWERLPAEVALQLHWPRTPEFVDKLTRHGFRVLTLARHPLDVLVSILHFSWYEPETRNWLLGEGGNEDGLRAAMPRSRTFVDYCTGPRAAALLNVTADWWGRPEVVSLRYEDAVADPLAACGVLAERFGPPRCPDLTAAVEGCSLAASRRGSQNNHFWKGQPGLWRELLPAAEANDILAAVRPACERLGYAADPDPALTPAAADAAWVRYAGQELADTVRRNLEGFNTEMNRVHRAVADEHTAKLAMTAERDAARQELAELIAALTDRRSVTPDAPPPAMRKHLGESAARIERLYSLQGFSVNLALFVQRLRDRLGGRKVARG